jgi:hypothetical protein
MNTCLIHCGNSFYTGIILSDDQKPGGVSCTPYYLLKLTLEQRGWSVGVWTEQNAASATVVYHFDLPVSRRALGEVFRLSPRAAHVLQISESPLGCPHYFRPDSYRGFSKVLTYDARHAEKYGLIHYRLPIKLPTTRFQGKPFADRVTLGVINSNKYTGFLNAPRPGLSAHPLLSNFLYGWAIRPWDPIEFVRCGQYSLRRKLLRCIEKMDGISVELTGPGWDGLASGWYRSFFPDRPYPFPKNGPARKHDFTGRYRFILAYENYRGAHGYMSEKIFDAMMMDAVPIYLGDENVDEEIPRNAFVDARKFKSNAKLLEYIRGIPEAEWNSYRTAAWEFLFSDRIKKFSAEYFSQLAAEVIEEAAREMNEASGHGLRPTR